MSNRIWMWLWMTLAFGYSVSAQPTTTEAKAMQIPRGNVAAIDGKLDEAEWADAAREKLTGGAELRLKADAEFLYVGLRGGGQGWPQLYVWEGKVVRALHASASLGTAVYSKGESKAWKLEQGFAWELRGAKADDPARTAFLTKHGWLANTVGMGEAGVGEFKIARRLFDESDLRLAVVYFTIGRSLPSWPATLKDDCLKSELLMGAATPGLSFDPAQWARIKWSEGR